MAAYTTLATAKAAIVTALKAKSLNATDDPRAVILPGAVVVGCPTISNQTLAASIGHVARYTIQLVHPGPDDKTADDWLEANIAKALAAAPIAEGDAVKEYVTAYSMDGSPMPAYVWQTRIPVSVTP